MAEPLEDHEAVKKKKDHVLLASGGWHEVLLTGESGKENQNNTVTLWTSGK